MALPPTIPTSFVPKQPVQATRKARRGGTGLFTIASLIVMGLAVAGAVATFGYQKILESTQSRRAEQLAAAEASINRDTIDEFLRLQNRLQATESVLDKHIALSQYFDVLEALTLQTVSLDGLEITVLPDGEATFSTQGSARSFNALAAQSAAFATERRIREAIFSDIQVGERGLVSFSMKAKIDPELIKWKGEVPEIPTAVVPAATSTAP